MTAPTSANGPTILDSAATIAAHDPSSFHALLEQLPAQARDAWALAQSWTLPPGFGMPSRVVLLGMGGSAIGADIVATIAGLRSRVPVEVVRDYDAPSLDDRALVIASSWVSAGVSGLRARAKLRQSSSGMVRKIRRSSGKLGS